VPPTPTGLGEATIDTVKSVTPLIEMSGENSDVFPASSVALADIAAPGGGAAGSDRLITQLPVESVVAMVVQIRV